MWDRHLLFVSGGLSCGGLSCASCRAWYNTQKMCTTLRLTNSYSFIVWMVVAGHNFVVENTAVSRLVSKVEFQPKKVLIWTGPSGKSSPSESSDFSNTSPLGHANFISRDRSQRSKTVSPGMFWGCSNDDKAELGVLSNQALKTTLQCSSKTQCVTQVSVHFLQGLQVSSVLLEVYQCAKVSVVYHM